jgi:hypothetical protein
LKPKQKTQRFELDGSKNLSEMEEDKPLEMQDKSSQSSPAELPSSRTPRLAYFPPAITNHEHYPVGSNYQPHNQVGDYATETYSPLGNCGNNTQESAFQHAAHNAMGTQHMMHGGISTQQHNPAQYSLQDFQLISPVGDRREYNALEPGMGTTSTWGSSWWTKDSREAPIAPAVTRNTQPVEPSGPLRTPLGEKGGWL